jgi:hypothetical protein
LLTFPERLGILFCLVFLGVNLLEWPVLLSRGYFESLWLIIPARMGILLLLAVEFWRPCRIARSREVSLDLPA